MAETQLPLRTGTPHPPSWCCRYTGAPAGPQRTQAREAVTGRPGRLGGRVTLRKALEPPDPRGADSDPLLGSLFCWLQLRFFPLPSAKTKPGGLSGLPPKSGSCRGGLPTSGSRTTALLDPGDGICSSSAAKKLPRTDTAIYRVLTLCPGTMLSILHAILTLTTAPRDGEPFSMFCRRGNQSSES